MPQVKISPSRLLLIFLVAFSLIVGSVQAQEAPSLVIAIPGDIRSLDPYGSELEVWVLIRNQIFDPLVRLDMTTGEYQPGLAESFEYTDPQTLVLNLRDGVKFHSGVDFSAADVEFSINRALTPETGGEWNARLGAIDEVVVDGSQVTLKLSKVDPSLMYYLSAFPILSAADGDAAATTPNGTGNYVFDSWEANNAIKLYRFADAWREASGNAETLEFRVISNSESRIASLLAGDVNFLFNVSLQDVPSLETEEGISVALVPPADSYWIIYLNTRKPPFDNVKVRQAVLTAFDRQTFGDAFTAGNSFPTNSPLAHENPYYNPAVDELYAYDMDAAAQLLEEAGYPGGTGLSFEIIYPSGFADMKAGSEMIQAAMTELGADVTVTELELATWSDRLVNTFDFDMSWDIRSRGLGDPVVLYSEATFYTPSEKNITGLMLGQMPEYEALLAAGAVEFDLDKRRGIYADVQQIWAENLPGYVVARRALAHAYSNTIEPFEPPLMNRFLDFAQLTVNA